MHDWQYFFQHDRTNLNQGNYRIFESEWKTEILHWFSRDDVAKNQKEEFIQALIDFDDGCGDFYRYRAYFLAAEALAWFPECSLGDAIVEQLLKWSYGYFRQDKRDWQILPELLVKAARKTLELTDRQRVIAAFVHLVHTTESRTILRLAAEKLAQLDPGNKSAIAALALLKSVPEDRVTFCETSDSQEKIAVGDETAFAALIQIMETTLNKDNCLDAIATLGKIAVGNQTAFVKDVGAAIAAFTKFLQINQGDRICFDAAKALWQIDPGNANAINSLVYILETSASTSLINYVAAYLLEIDSDNQTATNALFELVKNLGKSENDPEYAKYITWAATRRLLEIDPSHQLAINALVQLIKTAQNHSYLNIAVKELGSLGGGNPDVIAALIELISCTKNDYLLCDAAWSLGKIDLGNKIAIATLLQIIETTQDESICCQAAAYLGDLIPGDRLAINTLSQLLETTQSEWVLIYATQNLLKIDPTNPTAIATLCQIWQSNPYKNESFLLDAVRNLAQLDPAEKLVQEKLNEVILTLIQFIQTFKQDDDNQNCFNNQATTQLSYESFLLDIADSLTKILQTEHLLQVLTALKGYLNEQFYKNGSYRYEAVFNIIWHCAENLNYPDFYKAWHN
ncbi:MAG: HEAT repeat domain-containing protein [Aulosira sp. DedQUE10]|nr:HEAT repeat domain-containing protein [Aulosira sp. DedQUE10]